jgi:phosphoenolpyruvate carboxykinase (GTP)
LTAIVFGGRRRELAPLVFESLDWKHGVFAGASVASETTAAATGKVGVVRRDPMAMQPFCGYNFADYWSHWLSFGEKYKNLPKIFHVNWFRQNKDGEFLWPGFGDNLRVIRWVIDRCKGTAKANRTAIGWLPTEDAIDTRGLNLHPGAMHELLTVDKDAWKHEVGAIRDYFAHYGARMPKALVGELERIEKELQG